MDMDEPARSNELVLARKTHRKSRLGCQECKRRRVKCDEAKPACTNCRRRSTECSFLRDDGKPHSRSNRSSEAPQSAASPPHQAINQQNLPSLSALNPDEPHNRYTAAHVSASALREAAAVQAASQQLSEGFRPEPSQEVDSDVLELWHHWLTVGCYTFADNLDGLPLWRDNIPKISFANTYVAQLILALSALHMARIDASRAAQCLAKSHALQNAAISGMMDALSQAGDPSALWAASSLLAFCSFARGPAPGQYLLYAEEAEPEWLGLLHGVKSVLIHHPDALDRLIPDAKKHKDAGRSINPEDLIPGIAQAFADLRSSIDAFRAEDNSFDKYIHPMDELYTCFSEVFERSDSLPGERIGEREGIRVNSYQIFAWLYRLSHDYLVSLQERRPMALVILAHYLVLMSQLKDAWYLENWVPHIMEAIKRHMHPAYQRWLEWPQARLV